MERIRNMAIAGLAALVLAAGALAAAGPAASAATPASSSACATIPTASKSPATAARLSAHDHAREPEETPGRNPRENRLSDIASGPDRSSGIARHNAMRLS